MKNRLLGSILLILGSCIGAGMISLPVSSAELSFQTVIVSMLLGWIICAAGAWALVKLCIAAPPGSNMVTISGAIWGRFGQGLTVFLYLGLLYSLNCAYLSATGEIISALFKAAGMNLNGSLAVMLGMLIFTAILAGGIKRVDYINRRLMLLKLILFICLVSAIIPNVEMAHLQYATGGWTRDMQILAILSLTYAFIMPSVVAYLNYDFKRSMIAVVVGSLIPLFLFIAWVAMIHGLVPYGGADGLLEISRATKTNEALISSIYKLTQSALVPKASILFIVIVISTSFLGASLALKDFLRDGLSLPDTQQSNWLLNALTFLPSLLIVVFDPSIFQTVLHYSGVFATFGLVVLPLALLAASKLSDEQRISKTELS